MFEALFVSERGVEDSQDLYPAPSRKIAVRFVNYEPVTPMKFLKSNCIGKFVSVRGTVIRVSTIKPILLSMNFLCAKCGGEKNVTMSDGKFDCPGSCFVCKNKSMIPDRNSAITTDWQKVRLQEIVTDESREDGRMPRTIECELTDDLVDKCIPGDEIAISGIVKVVSTDGDGGHRGKNKCLFLLYIEANSISNSKKASGDKVLQNFCSVISTNY